jgi:hypothetical protein
VIAAETEVDAWGELARRERAPAEALRETGWQVAQELDRMPPRATVVYPGYYRRAIV